MRTTHRAVIRNVHRLGISWTPLQHHSHHLRNHIARSANNHRVTDHQAQPRHFIHVVQGGIGDHHTGNLDRFETCHGCHRTGTPHLEFNVEQLGKFFLGWVFMGNGPMRGARTKPQLLLILDVVDLEHHTVDVIGQAHTTLANIAVVVQASLNTLGQF